MTESVADLRRRYELEVLAARHAVDVQVALSRTEADDAELCARVNRLAAARRALAVVDEVVAVVSADAKAVVETTVFRRRPISEAPRDGTFVVLIGPSGYVTTPERVHVGRMMPNYKVGRRLTHDGDDFTDDGLEPTHFLPLDVLR